MGIEFFSMQIYNNIYLLSNSFHEGVNNLPMIQIHFYKPKLELSSYEALIFSSKNAVKALDALSLSWQQIPAFCIGVATAKEVQKCGGRVEFIATDSYGNAFAKEIGESLANKKVLFLRAKKVLSKLEEILKSLHVKLESQIMYETTCKKSNENKPCKNAVIIFTSPSTVECFFENFAWDESYKAICIGEVTAKYLPSSIKPFISEKQSISECICLAHSLS